MATSPMSSALCVIFYWLLVYVKIKGDMCMIKKEDNSLTIAVTNGSCVVHNWKEMICTWDLKAIMFEIKSSSENKSYGFQNTSLNQSTNVNFNHVDFDVKLEWTVLNRFSLCPNRVIKEHCLTCRFSENDGNDSFRIDNYKFLLQINNTKRNISKTSEWTFDTQTLVQPDRIYDLTVIPNKTEIDIHWKHTKGHYPQKYKIQYKSWQDSKWKKCKSRQQGTTLGNLKPFTNYTIRVLSIPIVEGKQRGYWSEPKITVTQTLEDVPSDVPELLPGYYMCCSDNCSCVHLLWKPIKEADKNGNITAYRLIIEDEYGLEREQLIVPANSTSAIIYINSNSTNVIRLTQRTSIGYPNIKDAFITLPPTKDRPSVPKNFLVEAFDPAHINVSWEISTPSEDNLYPDNITVIICKISKENICHRIIKSVTQSLVDNHLNIELSEGTYIDYLFGVSTESLSKTYGRTIGSGIKWSACTYQRSGVSTKPLRVHLVMLSMYQNSVTIRWTRYECSESVGYVQNYVVHYCVAEADNCIESHSVSIDRSKTDYIMNNLLPGKYKVWMNVNFSGGIGPESEVLIFQVVRKELKEEFPVVSPFIGLLLIFVFFLSLCAIGVALRKYCHNVNKSLEIDIPKPYTTVADRKKTNNLPPSHSSSGSSDTSEHSPFIRPVPGCKTLILEDISEQSRKIDPESESGQSASTGIDTNSASHFIKCKNGSDGHIPGSLSLVKNAKVAYDIHSKKDRSTKDTKDDFLEKQEYITHAHSTNNEQHYRTGDYTFNGSIDAYVKVNCTGNGCDMETSAFADSVGDYLKTYIVVRNSGLSSAMSYCDVSIRQLSKSTTNMVESEMLDRKYLDYSIDYSDANL